MAAPDDWVGQLVSVFVNGTEGSLLAELVDVNDRGIVVRLPEVPPRAPRYRRKGVRGYPSCHFTLGTHSIWSKSPKATS